MDSFDFSPTLRRLPGSVLLIGGFHLAVLWALVSALHIHNSSKPPADMQMAVIDAPKPPTPPPFTPADPGRRITMSPDPIPPTIGPLPPDDPPLTTPEAPITLPQVPEWPPVAHSQPVITGAAVDPHHPLTQPPYPMTAIRNNEEGSVALEVLVGVDGRVHDARIARSSGSDRLDKAAIAEARSRWQLRPATRDGVPFEQWLTLRVVFRLENR